MIQKLRDVRHEDIPEINNEKIRERVLEGDRDMKIRYRQEENNKVKYRYDNKIESYLEGIEDLSKEMKL